MKTLITFLGLASILHFTPHPAYAQQCPGTATFPAGVSARRTGAGTMTKLFVSSAGVIMGAATYCIQVYTIPGKVSFIAKWPSAAARTLDVTGGCDFT